MTYAGSVNTKRNLTKPSARVFRHSGFLVLLLTMLIAASTAYGDQKAIRVAINQDAPPFEYLDETGKPAGFLADTIKQLADALGLPVVFITSSPATAGTMLEEGTVDVRAVMCKDCPPTASVSQPLWYTSYSVIVRSDSRWASNAAIRNSAIATRTADLAQTAAAGLGSALVTFDTWASAINAVRNGTADCAIVPTVPGLRLLEERANRSLKMLHPPIWHTSYRLEFGPRAERLVGPMELQLAAMRDDGRLDSIGLHWLSAGELVPPQASAGLMLALLAMALTGAAVATAWALVLRGRQARLKTASEQSAGIPAPTLPTEPIGANDAEESAADANLSAESTTLIACLSQELRSPLLGASGALKMLKPAHLDPNDQQALDMATASIDQLGHIMDSIDAVVDARNGALFVEPAEFRFASFAQSMEDPIRQAAEAHGLTFRFTLQGSDRTIVSDAKRLGQIIRNLCDNAIKFTPHGEIDFLLGLTDDTLQIIVRDTGPGLPADADHGLFVPHYKDEKGNPAPKLGLGLTMAKEVIDALHGTITYRSSPGQGTEFSVAIPVSTATEATPVIIEATAEPPSPHRLDDNRRAIIAEDEAINRLYLKRVLELAGYQVAQASNGAIAMESAIEGSWDFILMDVSMPKMDGLEATRRIRAHESGQPGRHTPIIALTAHAYTEDRQACAQAGMDGFLSKPFTETALWAEIHRVLDSLEPHS